MINVNKIHDSNIILDNDNHRITIIKEKKNRLIVDEKNIVVVLIVRISNHIIMKEIFRSKSLIRPCNIQQHPAPHCDRSSYKPNRHRSSTTDEQSRWIFINVRFFSLLVVFPFLLFILLLSMSCENSFFRIIFFLFYCEMLMKHFLFCTGVLEVIQANVLGSPPSSLFPSFLSFAVLYLLRVLSLSLSLLYICTHVYRSIERNKRRTRTHVSLSSSLVFTNSFIRIGI